MHMVRQSFKDKDASKYSRAISSLDCYYCDYHSSPGKFRRHSELQASPIGIIVTPGSSRDLLCCTNELLMLQLNCFAGQLAKRRCQQGWSTSMVNFALLDQHQKRPVTHNRAWLRVQGPYPRYTIPLSHTANHLTTSWAKITAFFPTGLLSACGEMTERINWLAGNSPPPASEIHMCVLPGLHY
ncbi:uncharacterized protein J5F26_014300 [Ciconia maguari]